MDEQANDPKALRAALDHIAATARNSRSSTRRLRWIERRAEMALAGEPYSNEACGDLPKSAGDTAEKARLAMLSERAAALSTITKLQERLEAADRLRELSLAVIRHLDEDSPSAPGHAHEVPGRWDMDNGPRAGKPCLRCCTWLAFKRAAIDQAIAQE